MKLEGKISFSGNLDMRRKHSLSKWHFQAASYFAEACDQIERSTPKPKGSDQTERSIIIKHRAYVTGTIFSVVAALEASINELYHEAKNNEYDKLPGYSTKKLKKLTSKLKQYEENHVELLEKYQDALECIGAEKFDKGKLPFQDVDSLISLRNALVHYRPEWDDETKFHEKIRLRLKCKFPTNKFCEGNFLWFPHQCLCAGCAKWAVKIAGEFIIDFCSRMNIPSRFRLN